ncbi:MAG: DciA family protein [Gammaproteobacteria bacterium]
MQKKPIYFKKPDDFPNRSIAHIYTSIIKHQQILRKIRAALPGALANQAVDCVDKGERLVVFAASAAWASQLRFHAAEMLASLQADGYRSFESVQIKIAGRLETGDAAKPLPNKPSQESVDVVRTNALYSSDEDLKASLLRLSRTLNKLRNE